MPLKKGSSRISLQPSGTGGRIAMKSTVVLSQARGNGVYGNFSEDTFPAVPAQEPAITSTCRASLKACLSILSRTESHHMRSPRSPATTARGESAASQDRAAGVVNGGLTRRSGERHASRCRSKNRDGILPCFTPSADPRLHLHRPLAREQDAEMQRDRSTCRRPPDHHLQRNPRRTRIWWMGAPPCRSRTFCARNHAR